MSMSGPFVPDDFEPQVNDIGGIKLAAIAWGFTLGFGCLICSKALKQTRTVWRRSHRLNTYIVLVSVEIISSLVYGVLAWLMMDGSMPMKLVRCFVVSSTKANHFYSFYALFAIVVA